MNLDIYMDLKNTKEGRKSKLFLILKEISSSKFPVRNFFFKFLIPLRSK